MPVSKPQAHAFVPIHTILCIPSPLLDCHCPLPCRRSFPKLESFRLQYRSFRLLRQLSSSSGILSSRSRHAVCLSHPFCTPDATLTHPAHAPCLLRQQAMTPRTRRWRSVLLNAKATAIVMLDSSITASASAEIRLLVR